jgi:hypothetical protein
VVRHAERVRAYQATYSHDRKPWMIAQMMEWC